MKPAVKRFVLLLVSLLFSAARLMPQGDSLRPLDPSFLEWQIGSAYQQFATLTNAWAERHNQYLTSPKEHEQINAIRKAFKRLDSAWKAEGF